MKFSTYLNRRVFIMEGVHKDASRMLELLDQLTVAKVLTVNTSLDNGTVAGVKR